MHYIPLGATAALAAVAALIFPADGAVASAGADVAGLVILPVAGAAGAVLAGWITGASLRNMRGDYFAAATLILSEVFVLLAANLDFLGGALGFELRVSRESLRHTHVDAWNAAVLTLAASANAAIWLLARRLSSTRFGLQLEAARDNPIAAAASGIEGAHHQGRVFVASCGFAGFAGGLFLYYTANIVPNDFSFVSGLPIIICVVLGRSSSVGTAIATVGLYVAEAALQLRLLGLFGSRIGGTMAEMRGLFMAIVLILAVLAGPALHRLPFAAAFLRTAWKRSQPGAV